MPGYVIAVLLCAGSTCDMAPLEPGISYASDTECSAALSAKGAGLADAAAARRPGARQAQTLCIQATQAVVDVAEQYDVQETSVVHSAPSAESGYVGVVEGGQRALVTGLVAGTDWVRVTLPEGGSGFMASDTLRRVAAQAGVPGPAAVPPGAGLPGPTASSPAVPQTVLQSLPQPASQPAVATPQVSASVQPVAAVAPAPAYAPGSPTAPGHPMMVIEVQDCPTCPVLLRLPGGSFTMGSTRDASERPTRRVSVPAFAMGKYPVTVAEWGACVAAGGCAYKPAAARGQDGDQGDAGRKPMTNLNWNDATQYVQWLSQTTAKAYRLPSEAEWEYAARAGTNTRYSWGDRAGAGQADCNGCGGPRDPRSPAEVTTFPANPWGLSGMGGGVAQWVEDCWHSSYQAAPVDGTAWRMDRCQQKRRARRLLAQPAKRRHRLRTQPL